jgi:hypothetical protein
MNFIYSIQSEWLKTKRSAAFWLMLAGGFFIPVIDLIVFIKLRSKIKLPIEGLFSWQLIFNELWQSMVGFLLPVGVILTSSLITQMEFKNNTWKQLHTTPQSYTVIFLSKFSVILLMLLEFFIFFNIGIILCGIIPSLIFEKHFPNQAFPFLFFLKGNVKFFITMLPIVALQYLLSLQFKNFMASIGTGLLVLIGTLIGSRWQYIFISPYSYGALSMFSHHNDTLNVNIYLLAFCYFVLIMSVSYFLYIRKKEKG